MDGDETTRVVCMPNLMVMMGHTSLQGGKEIGGEMFPMMGHPGGPGGNASVTLLLLFFFRKMMSITRRAI
ncbi:hypothetical protein SUGI_0348580 [Cryptomeria japonica]|nr:hypothetical protein SUGI_0348580 [Cryptomeria japonica]